jgi:hypothetical protein
VNEKAHLHEPLGHYDDDDDDDDDDVDIYDESCLLATTTYNMIYTTDNH